MANFPDVEVCIYREREARLVQDGAVGDLKKTIAASRIFGVVENVVLAMRIDDAAQVLFRRERDACFAGPYDEEVSFKFKALPEWEFACTFKRSICRRAEAEVGKD